MMKLVDVVLNQVTCRMIRFLNRLGYRKQRKCACILYKLVKAMHVDPNNEFSSKWIDMIDSTLNEVGMGNIWLLDGDNHARSWVMSNPSLRLNDMSKQDWHAAKQTNCVCSNYRSFNEALVMEEYLTRLSFIDRNNLCKYRCRSHNLPVNNGRFIEVPRSEMQCVLCNTGEVDDEYHFF